MNIRSYINILCNFGETWISEVTKYFMAIRDNMNIRSYINILCNYSGQHGYPKLHKYFIANSGNMNIRSYINILC